MTVARDDIHTFFATCPRHTEGLLLDELRDIGAEDAAETRSGAHFSGPLSLAYRACLWSRTASRVLLRLYPLPLGSPDELYERARDLPWEDHLHPDGTMAVEVTSTIRQGPLADLNTHFMALRIKDAVVDRLRDLTGRRPSVDLLRPDVRLNVHLSPEGAAISLDLSGDGLHRRGYRLEGGGAPLRENLAAAILLRAGWPEIAAQGGTLLDPMCGSGTLLVEGAFMAADIAPGLLREYYGFLGWRGFDPAPWQELMDEAQERRDEGLRRLPAVYGYDSDAKAISIARANVRRAGLAGRMALEQKPLKALTAPTGEPGLVVANPPYGKRLGEIDALIEVYETLGQKLRRSFSGWQAAVFTGNPELGAHLDLRAHRANTLYNGPISCKLLLFDIDPERFRAEAVRSQGKARAGAVATSRADEPVTGLSPGAEMFANRLKKNLRHLRRWAARESITCFRAYDADLPEYAVAVDIYEGWAHVQEYAPPRTVDPVKARRRLKEVMAVVPTALDIPAERVVQKVRRPQRGRQQYQRLGDDDRFIEVAEGGLRFLVNLTDYLDTGLFLDHRITRGLIREAAPGRRFLNLFAYTGTATVYAAAGGAATTTTVDLSSTYLDWAARNLELNHLAGPAHSFVRADCLQWLRAAARDRASRGAYDLVFLDPPTFSNSKSMEDVLDIQRDHGALIRDAASLLTPSGILFFSTNYRRFKLDADLTQEYAVRDITKQTIPEDFSRRPDIHQCYRIERGRGRDPR